MEVVMKKLLVLFFAVFLTAGMAVAQESSILAGAEVGIRNLETAEDTMFIRPMIAYERTDSLSGLDLYAELGFPFWTNPEFWLGLDLNLRAAFTWEVGFRSFMTLFVENWTYIPLISDGDIIFSTLSSPMQPSNNSFGMSYRTSSYTSVGIQYAYSLNNERIYASVEMPFNMIEEGKDFFDIALLNFTFGMETARGLGGGLTLYNYIKNGEGSTDFFYALDLFGSFRRGPLFLGITLGFAMDNDQRNMEGITLVPEMQLNIGSALIIYGSLPITGIGSDDNTNFGLAIGVGFRL